MLHTLFCGICIAAEWGCEFAYIAFTHIWYITPMIKVLEINCGCCQKLYGTCVHCCMDPICEACGMLFYAFKKGDWQRNKTIDWKRSSSSCLHVRIIHNKWTKWVKGIFNSSLNTSHLLIFSWICNPSLNTIHHDVFVYKACQFKFMIEYFIGWLIRSFVISHAYLKILSGLCQNKPSLECRSLDA